jgi:hypothetical protein
VFKDFVKDKQSFLCHPGNIYSFSVSIKTFTTLSSHKSRKETWKQQDWKNIDIARIALGVELTALAKPLVEADLSFADFLSTHRPKQCGSKT